MTAREYCLASVLAPQPARGLVVVFKGGNEPTDETPERWDVAKRLNPFAVMAEGDNTWEEAQWAVRQAERDLTIVTSAYHQLRSFLTALQALKLAGTDRVIRVWNRPAPSDLAKLQDEYSKIALYHVYGHVANYQTGWQYLQWRQSGHDSVAA